MKQITVIAQDDGKYLVGEDQPAKVIKLSNSIEVKTLEAAIAIVRDLASPEVDSANDSFNEGFDGKAEKSKAKKSA